MDFPTSKKLYGLIKNKQFDLFIDLLKSDDNIDVNIRDNNNTYLIQYAIMYNNITIVDELLNKNCKLDFLDDEGRSLLYIPIKFEYIDIIKKLLMNNNMIGIPLVDIIDKSGNLPLHYAVFYENNEIFDILIKESMQLNKLNNEGYSPLHLSIKKKNYYAFNKLIDIDVININSQTVLGESPLHIACNYEDDNVIDILLDRKDINIDVIDYENQITPLMYIVSLNNINITKKILSRNPDLNIQNASGNSVLHIAIIENNIVIANILINKINDFNLINIDGMTPLHLLLTEYIEDISNLNKYNIDMLLNKTKINIQDFNGNTIWHILTFNDMWFNYKNILQNKKNNIFIKNSENITPYDMLKKSPKFDILLNIIINSYYNLLISEKKTYVLEWENKCSLKKENETKCKELIRNNIINNNKSVPEKKTSYCKIDINVDDNTLFTTFTGLLLDILCGLKLLHTNNNIMSSLNNKNLINNSELQKYYDQLGIRKNKNDFFNFEIQWLYQNIFFPENFNDIIEQFLKKKEVNIFIVPIGIEIENGAHANILLYDKNTNVLERFEPYGSDNPPNFNYNSSLLDTLLNNYFKKYFKNMKYNSPKKFLPKIGFQSYESIESNRNKKIGDPSGFCAAWCLWYIYNRLKYISMPSNELVLQLITDIKYNNLSFKTIIRNYSKTLNNYRDTILSQINIDINEWINDQYDINDVNAIQKIIIKDL